uniref:Tc1-like transposase DDE domain-containing protein n=2 Tax=Clastoptera arizonana TaxID=38151 RepID=A0A1B6CQC5_9HEMI
MSDVGYFHLNGVWPRPKCMFHLKTSDTGPVKIYALYMNYHYTAPKLRCGVLSENLVSLVSKDFFEENGNTVTVTAARYVNMVNNFLITELRRQQINVADVYFQQDGATAHTARVSMAAVRQIFPNRVISRFGYLHWPPRSPDLSMCDFFLWGFLKSRVYENKPRTLGELRQSIEQNVAQINRQLLERVEANFKKRLHICQRENGHHLNDFNFYT